MSITSRSLTRNDSWSHAVEYLRQWWYVFALNETDICNFADDTTPYVCDLNLKSVLEKLEHNFETAIAWFEMKFMKLNTDKCDLVISGNKDVDKTASRYGLVN